MTATQVMVASVDITECPILQVIGGTLSMVLGNAVLRPLLTASHVQVECGEPGALK